MLKRVTHTKLIVILGFIMIVSLTILGIKLIYNATGFLALGAILLFLFLSLRSLKKNQKYRSELEESKKMTEKLLVAKERLILSITHDIKAPLSSIIGYLELLEKSKFPEKERYYLENMQNSAEHVLNLVKNLLDYHVLESHKPEINTMSFSPVILMNSIYQSFVPLAKQGNIHFEYKTSINEKEGVSYISDPYRLRQIINNLLSNAIKFTPEDGTVLLETSITREEEQEILKISVKDNGFGISDEYKSSIFEEFKRLKTSTGAEGSGLGLAITQKLIVLLSGEIDLVSEIGKGSEFIVKIPMQRSDATPENVRNSSQKKHNVKLNIGSDKKILFIDDDLIQLNIYSELMKYEGVTPIVCHNSLHALELIQKEEFDIVFTDIQMPDMNGVMLVERIRMGSFPGCKTLPIIALSGSSDMQECDYFEAGFSGFLPKPFTSNQLLFLIQKFLGSNSLHLSSSSNNPIEKEGLSKLSGFAGDDIEAGAEIIQSFINENKQNLHIIKEALSNNDWEIIQKTSHKMLPLMKMISSEKIVLILSEFETGGQDKENGINLLELLEIQIKEAENFLSLLNNK